MAGHIHWSRGWIRLLSDLLLATAVVLFAPAVGATEPDRATLQAVFPDGDGFGPFEGDPPAAVVYKQGDVIGYILKTRDVVASVGYSGKPLDVLVGLRLDGILTGAVILEHHEPILVIGVDSEDLTEFAKQYAGLDIRRPYSVTSGSPDEDEVDAISGATVSSAILNNAILQSARAVARSRGLFGAVGRRLDRDGYAPATWQDLLDTGAVASLRLTAGDVRKRFGDDRATPFVAGVTPADDAVFLEIFTALATPAAIGRNLLGDVAYSETIGQYGADEQAVLVAGRGIFSFKGTDYLKSGVFDRIQIVQGDKTFILTRDDYVRPEAIEAAGATDLRDIALFRLGADFDPLQDWRLDVLIGGHALDGDGETTEIYALPYALPSRYIIGGGEAAEETAPQLALWQQRWLDRSVEVVILTAALMALTLVLVLQDGLVRRKRLYRTIRTGFLIFTLVWLGWYAGAQLSVLNVLTFAGALRTGFSWEFFLVEPLIFILWGYVAIALLFWGRGVFCGWICPFGALQELVGKAAQRLGVPQVKLPFVVHERLWPIKYIAFVALFGMSLGNIELANQWAEVEPFKTAIVLRFDRPWPYVLYALLLLAIATTLERPFCRYLCPLGAAIAIPARLRMFEWLRRRQQCGSQCHICSVKCPVQAIHRDGKINPNECIYCLACQEVMHDDSVCLPLIARRKRRQGPGPSSGTAADAAEAS